MFDRCTNIEKVNFGELAYSNIKEFGILIGCSNVKEIKTDGKKDNK